MNYAEAVEDARCYLEAAFSEGPFDLLPRSAGGALKAGTLQARGAHFVLDKPEQIIAKAEDDADAFDSLRFGAAQWMRIGTPLPPEIAIWIADYLCDKKKRPRSTKRGRKRKDALHLDIYVAVKHLVDAGINLTRNEDEKNPTSACDAVAEAMALLGQKPCTYSGVSKIFFRLRALEQPNGGIRLPD